jgi:glycerol-3-phosphate acyltransferase PlsY
MKAYWWLPVSYLIGSVPTGLIVAKAIYHSDLRKLGSGNIGATNVMRNFGVQPFLGVLAIDMLKGVLAVQGAEALGLSRPLVLLAGLLSIVGHNWCIWLRFSGGKGIATSGGVIIAAFPWQVIAVVIGVFLVVVAASRIMSAGSLSAAAAFPLSVAIYYRGSMGAEWSALAFSLVTAAFAFYRHRDNIRRLMRGEEPRISSGGKKGAAR